MFSRDFQIFRLTLKLLCTRRPLNKLNLSRRGWASRSNDENLDPKTLPKLVYLHNPLTYLQTKFQFFKLRLFWDRDFEQQEFIRGTKQSAIVMTDSIRKQDGMGISQYATPIGFQQITRDMILSRNDTRLKLVHFRVDDIHRAIPMKVSLFKRAGRKNCLVDMVFVGMRNIRDFSDPVEGKMMLQTLERLDKEMRASARVLRVPHRILFAEIYMRFYRDYAPAMIENWAVSFYKIISFDVLNYDPE